ncbi:MAG: transposase-like protein [Candidatus Azotimanducaceae bacterium]|jgi:transposase-like protein
MASTSKIKAVKLSFKDGLQVKQVAEVLDIHSFMLSRWRKENPEGKLQGCSNRTLGALANRHAPDRYRYFSLE